MENRNITTKIIVCSYDELNEEEKKLIDAAKEATNRSYSPYSLSLIHISEPTRQAEISYAVFCLKKKKKKITQRHAEVNTCNMNR